MNSKRTVFLPLAFAVLLLDQLGKLHATDNLAVGVRVPLVTDVLSFTYSESAASAFGFFAQWSMAAQFIGFALVSVAATIMIIHFFRGLAPGEFGSAAGLGAILGGVVSHAIDRLRTGASIDFLHVGSQSGNGLPDFNLADVAIALGVATLIVELLATEMAARANERPRH